jgi:hypothetical protein
MKCETQKLTKKQSQLKEKKQEKKRESTQKEASYHEAINCKTTSFYYQIAIYGVK